MITSLVQGLRPYLSKTMMVSSDSVALAGGKAKVWPNFEHDSVKNLRNKGNINNFSFVHLSERTKKVHGFKTLKSSFSAI